MDLTFIHFRGTGFRNSDHPLFVGVLSNGLYSEYVLPLPEGFEPDEKQRDSIERSGWRASEAPPAGAYDTCLARVREDITKLLESAPLAVYGTFGQRFAVKLLGAPAVGLKVLEVQRAHRAVAPNHRSLAAAAEHLGLEFEDHSLVRTLSLFEHMVRVAGTPDDLFVELQPLATKD